MTFHRAHSYLWLFAVLLLALAPQTSRASCGRYTVMGGHSTLAMFSGLEPIQQPAFLPPVDHDSTRTPFNPLSPCFGFGCDRESKPPFAQPVPTRYLLLCALPQTGFHTEVHSSPGYPHLNERRVLSDLADRLDRPPR